MIIGYGLSRVKGSKPFFPFFLVKYNIPFDHADGVILFDKLRTGCGELALEVGH
ncbi:MAG: hypothetical protein GXP52_05980 [Deltaproteobacteria bacterium]|nr:hypothetical protein [Deltaproteobacteria bacterium]